MRAQLTNLLGLRYRLLWAHVRSRKGKTVLFFVAYLLACLIGAFLAMGGFSAAMASIRLGKAELVARVALGGFYMFGIFASVVLGIGVNEVFSDAVLRRYPLSAGARLAARHLTAFLEPLWMFLLAFNLGVAFGFYVFGVASLWLAALAAILLVVTNFLLARVFTGAFGWLMASRYAPLGLFALAGASLGLPLSFRNPTFQAAVAAVFSYTPPFAAARVMVGTAGLSSLMGMALLLFWCGGLGSCWSLWTGFRILRARLPGPAPPGTAPTTGSPLSSVPDWLLWSARRCGITSAVPTRATTIL